MVSLMASRNSGDTILNSELSMVSPDAQAGLWPGPVSETMSCVHTGGAVVCVPVRNFQLQMSEISVGAHSCAIHSRL